jgi:hypothetical protein
MELDAKDCARGCGTKGFVKKRAGRGKFDVKVLANGGVSLIEGRT